MFDAIRRRVFGTQIAIHESQVVKFNVPVTIIPEGDNDMIKATIEQVEDAGAIPEALAAETMRLLKIHQVNGDLDWVRDMILELEVQARRTPILGAGTVAQPEQRPNISA